MSVELNESSVSTHQSNARRTRLTASLQLIISVLILTTLAACSPTRVMMHHKEARERLITLQEHQIQDNLVRIKVSRNFLHVNYKSIKGVSYDEFTGKGEFGDDDRITAGGGSIVIDNDLGQFPRGEVALKFTDEFDVLAEPVMGNKTVYDAYVIFAEQFMETYESGSKHLWKREITTDAGEKKTFYVPDTPVAKKAYQRIVVLTTLDQGANRKVALVQIQVDTDTLAATVPTSSTHALLPVKLHPKTPVQSGVLLPRNLHELLDRSNLSQSELEAYKEMTSIVLQREQLDNPQDAETQSINIKKVTEDINGTSTVTETITENKKKVPQYGVFTGNKNGSTKQLLKKIVEKLDGQWIMLEYEPASSGSSPATIRIGKESTNIQVRQ